MIPSAQGELFLIQVHLGIEGRIFIQGNLYYPVAPTLCKGRLGYPGGGNLLYIGRPYALHGHLIQRVPLIFRGAFPISRVPVPSWGYSYQGTLLLFRNTYTTVEGRLCYPEAPLLLRKFGARALRSALASIDCSIIGLRCA